MDMEKKLSVILNPTYLMANIKIVIVLRYNLIRDRKPVCINTEDGNADYTVEKTSALAPGSLSWILIRVLTTASTFVEWLPFENKEGNT